MRDRRGWLPVEWMDEMPPEQGEHPNDFVKRAGDQLMLAPIEECEVVPTALSNGQIVGFMWHEERGSQTLTIRSATDWSIDAPFPADTNCFCDEEADYESMCDDLGEVVKHWIDDGFNELPGTIEVEGWTWSNTEWFKLEVLESGAAVFEPHPSIGAEGAARRFSAERVRQIEVEGFSLSRDQVLNAGGQLLVAAQCYLARSQCYGYGGDDAVPAGWPWDAKWWKPKDETADLVRAGALCLAELDRLARATPKLSDAAARDTLATATRWLAGRPS